MQCHAHRVKLFVVRLNLVSASLKGFEFIPAITEYIKPFLKIGGICGII
jgi:hypothetical protein